MAEGIAGNINGLIKLIKWTFIILIITNLLSIGLCIFKRPNRKDNETKTNNMQNSLINKKTNLI